MNRLRDAFGRRISYLRLSVTDRCDFRCVYCMAEEMHFLPRDRVLRFEEIEEVARVFVSLGTEKIRLTGGEPLIRQGLVALAARLARIEGLRTLALTTNGSRLSQLAHDLAAAGVQRLNISLDSLRAERFRALTRTGDLAQVLAGIETARRAGFERIKLNTVALRGRNHDELIDLVTFAADRGLDISFIEEMPLGVIDEHDRALTFLPSADIRDILSARFDLSAEEPGQDNGGPSRYWRLQGYDTRVGFISPHSHNFCDQCNRVRLTTEGRLLLCLGHEHSVDLRAVLRQPDYQREQLLAAVRAAMDIKPQRHEFNLEEKPMVLRFMNATGG